MRWTKRWTKRRTNRIPGGLVVLATGGTGGHVFPAEALAVDLGARGRALALITDRRGSGFGGQLAKIETHRVRAAGIAGKGIARGIASLGELSWGFIQAANLLRMLQPSVVVGFGGYASVPTMLAASLGGRKTVIHEQNAVLGRANRLLARRAQAIATSFERVKALPAEVAGKVIHTGMPVRPAIAALGGSAYPPIEGADKLHLLVLGGSQGASIFSQVVPPAVGLLPDGLRQKLAVTQQCRPEDLAHTRRAYADLGVEAKLSEFFDDIPQHIANAHLIISRSGASTMAEITAIGRPAIFIPYPHAVDDHQTANAEAIDAAGGGWLIPQGSFEPDAIAARLTSLFSMPRILAGAAHAAGAVGRSDAAARLADMICEMLPSNGGGEIRKEAA